MGTEDQATVEESTEPPIYGFAHATSPSPPEAVGIGTQRPNPDSDLSAPGPTPTPQHHHATAVHPAAAATPHPPPPATTESPVTDIVHPHTVQFDHLERVYKTDLQHGLTNAEAASRLGQDGSNKVKGAKGLSLWKILLRQVSNSLTLVLFAVMAISFAISDYVEGGVIAAVIVINIVVGLIQDYRAEQTIQSLYALSAPTCKVLRQDQIETIKAEELVKGDIVSLKVGDIIPADLRLVDGLNLSTDEAHLTGESLPISKDPEAVLSDPALPVGDRINMLYSVSTITRGRGTGLVVATGMATEVGKIANMLRGGSSDGNETPRAVPLWKRVVASGRNILGLEGTPLQVKLSKFALILFAFAIFLTLIVFAVSKFHITDEVLIYGICVGVAVIPESLVAVLTISMALGTKAMARGNVIVRKLSALEAVGGVTNICSDKTGTLTQGKMITRKIWLPSGATATVEGCTHPFDPTSGRVVWGTHEEETAATRNAVSDLPEEAKTLVDCISLCNNSIVTDRKTTGGDDLAETSTMSTSPQPDWTAIGEPTEIALHVFAMRFGLDKSSVMQSNAAKIVTEFPFDSLCKRMTVLYQQTGTNIVNVYTKGALEVILPLLDISDTLKAEFTAKAESLAAEGLRVLCIAHKIVDASDDISQSREIAESQLTPLGLVGLYDPPRAETAGAVAKCRKAGISVHMLTGDHIKTATAIAYEVGIIEQNLSPSEAAQMIMPASAFDALTDEQITSLDRLPLVLARCSPATKVRMVEAMHRRGAFCVMTGDGVNDSPALKKSDVGIAMGLNGSDVAKEAADMVLTDDNFSSIVTAVEEGRRLFDNIQKFLLHLLVSNIAQVILLLLGLAFKDQDGNSVFPLSPLEILWANLITSSFLALGLGIEEAQPDIMIRPPHDLRAGVFTREIIMDKFVYGFFMGSLCLAAFALTAAGSNVPFPVVLGKGCNSSYNDSCAVVFRARATTFATLSFLLLITAWEVKHLTRSLFNMNPEYYQGPFSVFKTVYRNKFLFGAVLGGFLTTFPLIYIPFINRTIFKHESIGWEWGVVVGCVVVYLVLVEAWKAGKRRFGKSISVYGQVVEEKV